MDVPEEQPRQRPVTAWGARPCRRSGWCPLVEAKLAPGQHRRTQRVLEDVAEVGHARSQCPDGLTPICLEYALPSWNIVRVHGWNVWRDVAKSTFLVSISLVIGLGPPPEEHFDSPARPLWSTHRIEIEAGEWLIAFGTGRSARLLTRWIRWPPSRRVGPNSLAY